VVCVARCACGVLVVCVVQCVVQLNAVHCVAVARTYLQTRVWLKLTLHGLQSYAIEAALPPCWRRLYFGASRSVSSCGPLLGYSRHLDLQDFLLLFVLTQPHTGKLHLFLVKAAHIFDGPQHSTS